MAETEVKEQEVEQTQQEIEIETVTKAVESGTIKLPSKYKTVDDWVKSYTELQTQNTRISQENAALKKATPTTEAKAAPVTKETSIAGAFEVTEEEAAQPIWASIDTELNTTGDLSAETRALLTAQGVPDSVVSTVIAGAKARQAQGLADAEKEVGGADTFKAITAWAKKNMSSEDLTVVKQNLTGPGWKLALRGLHSLYKDSLVKEPTNMNLEQGTGRSDIKPYANQKEMSKDINDQRYQRQTDPEFVKQVQARIVATSQQGR